MWRQQGKGATGPGVELRAVPKSNRLLASLKPKLDGRSATGGSWRVSDGGCSGTDDSLTAAKAGPGGGPSCKKKHLRTFRTARVKLPPAVPPNHPRPPASRCLIYFWCGALLSEGLAQSSVFPLGINAGVSAVVALALSIGPEIDSHPASLVTGAPCAHWWLHRTPRGPQWWPPGCWVPWAQADKDFALQGPPGWPSGCPIPCAHSPFYVTPQGPWPTGSPICRLTPL